MPDLLQTLRSTLRNPFLQTRVDNAWDARSVPHDVPSINDKAFNEVLRTIREVRQSRQSHGLLLSGEPGSGKTHVLNRVRRWIQSDEHAWFVYILPITAPDRVYRDILQATVGDITRSAPETHGINQLAIAVARHFMADVQAPIRDIAEWWMRVSAEYPEGDALAAYLQKHLSTLTVPLNLDGSVVRVVAQFLAGRNRAAARDWLLGRSLPEETLTELGVAFDLDDESTALTALTTLVRLGGGEFCTVVFAFDQIEGLQIDPDDRAGLLAFAHAAAQLLALHENVAIVTCSQVSFVGTLETIVGRALYDRLAERESRLNLLTQADALQLTRQRLRSDVDLEQVRLYVRKHENVEDPVWPLTSSAIELLSISNVSARHLLLRCRHLFDEWLERNEPAIASSGAPLPAPQPVAQSADVAPPFDDAWESALDEERERPNLKIDDGVIIDGLIRAADSDRGLTAERATKVRDIDVVMRRDARTIGVAVCNAENLTSLSTRLKRLTQINHSKKYDELVIVRDQRLPIKATARATQQHLRTLVEGGARVVRLPAEAYAALAALRRLLADAAAGDLTLAGRRIQPEELKKWLAENTPVIISDAVVSVAGGAAIDSESEQEHVSRLQELLQGRWILPLAVLASDAKLSADELRDVLSRESAVFGTISGDPDLVFLRSDALERV